MRKAPHIMGATLLLLAACAAQQEEAPKLTTPETEEEKQLYAIGLSVAGNTLSTFKGEFSREEVDLIAAGFADGLLEVDPKVDIQQYAPRLNTYLQQRFANVQARRNQQASAAREAGRAFLEAAAREPGAIKTESGIVYIERVAGTGPRPQSTDSVTVHYTGKLIDGTVFDSSVERGVPVTYPLDQFVPGWAEGVGMMKVGGKARIVIPSELAYGDQPNPNSPIPPGATLDFEVELLGIKGVE